MAYSASAAARVRDRAATPDAPQGQPQFPELRHPGSPSSKNGLALPLRRLALLLQAAAIQCKRQRRRNPERKADERGGQVLKRGAISVHIGPCWAEQEPMLASKWLTG